MGLPCQTADDLADSRHSLDDARAAACDHGHNRSAGTRACEGDAPPRLRISYEDGAVADIDAPASGARLHTAADRKRPVTIRSTSDQSSLTLAVAPAQMRNDFRHPPEANAFGDWPLKSMGCVRPTTAESVTWRALLRSARAAAALKADALALSPTHALFAADPNHFSPYSPSNRIFYNPLHADAATIFGDARVAKARSDAADQ